MVRQWEYLFANVYDHGPLEVRPDQPLDRNRWLDEQLKRLNDLGAAGWEVVTFLGHPHSEGTLLLKREKSVKG